MIVDSLVLVVLLISALTAFFRGFIREVLTIGAALGGSAAAYAFGPYLKPFMRGWLGVTHGNPGEVVAAVQEGTEGAAEAVPAKLFGVLPYDIVADGMSYGAVFITVLIVLSIISHFIAEGVRHLGLGAVDRTLGFMFGVGRGVILLGILYLPVHFFVDQDSKDAWFAGSKTQFYLAHVSGTIAGYMPANTVDSVKGSVGQISSTREQLQNIDLLKRNLTEIQKQDPVNGAPAKEGYTEDFRENMDQLFKDKTQSPPNKAPEEKAP